MEKKLKQFTFYELYWKLIKNASDKQAGRFALSASRFMFDDVEFDEPQDDMEAFIIDNAEDVLRKTKKKEIAGKIPKAYNKEMQHFAFFRKQISCHGLRHTYCSLLLSQNVPIQTVSKYMGHSDSMVTLKVYSHFIPDTQEKVLTALDNITKK